MGKIETCHLYDRPVCDVTDKECEKCQLEHIWNGTLSLIINDINTETGKGAFSFKVKGSLNEAQKISTKIKIEKLQRIELLMDNLNTQKE